MADLKGSGNLRTHKILGDRRKGVNRTAIIFGANAMKMQKIGAAGTPVKAERHAIWKTKVIGQSRKNA
jgi:hypothetical protein